MLWWKFWEKRNPLFLVDPMIAAGIAVDHFLSHKRPFSDSDWRSPGIHIPSEHEPLIRACVIGYQLFIYLRLIEEKFGPEISRIIREYQLIALSRLPDQMANQTSELLGIIARAYEVATNNPMQIPDHPNAQVPVERPMALYLLFFEMKDSPYYCSPNRQKVGDTPEIHDGLDRVLADCLAYGKTVALEVFDPMVQMLELKPESVAGLLRKAPLSTTDSVYMELLWSAAPGCYERHLQRKYRNPLFAPALRIVTQDEVDAARARDALEAEALSKQVNQFLQSVKRASATYSEMERDRKRVAELMQRAAEVGDLWAEGAASKLYWGIISDMEAAVINNEKGAKLLQEANEYYVRHVLLFTNRFVAQFSREDSPIKPEELVPALLTEDVESIKKFLSVGGNDDESQMARRNLASEALDLVMEVETRGAIIPDVDKKLEALGIRRKH